MHPERPPLEADAGPPGACTGARHAPDSVRPAATLLATQFLSALADHTLLILAIALLQQAQAPAWMTPMLKFTFILAYVLLAFWVGRWADLRPKRDVMFAANLLKAGGCMALIAGVHPLLAYGLVGVGAAAYSPAKYGLLTELLPARMLVRANAWLEGLTIGSVILGTVLGGLFVNRELLGALHRVAGHDALTLLPGLFAALMLYGISAVLNLRVPDSGRRYLAPAQPALTVFAGALAALWADRLARISLLCTTLLWGVGAVLQFLVLDWGRQALGLSLDSAALLQAGFGVGVAVGAVLAARLLVLERVERMLPWSLLLGPLLLIILPLSGSVIGTALHIGVMGLAAGLFVVPMNALLQHRGYVLLNAGQSIAVQNFCENLSVLGVVALYAMALKQTAALDHIVIGLAAVLSACLLLIWRLNRQQGTAVPPP